MATGFKTATVNASSVPSTQTNFPAYVDLSRLGITTQAEADSVRVYADSGKVTEWAREIVSSSQMWVKIPSLTSTTAIYVDWNGTSPDYANTDTYGRNAVWTDYKAVYHLDTITTDYTGNSYTLTNYNTLTSVSSVIGNGASQGSSNTNKSLYNNTDFGITAGSSRTITMWIKANNEISTGSWNLFTQSGTGASQAVYRVLYDYNSGTRQLRWMRTGSAYTPYTYNVTLGTSNSYHVALIYDGTVVKGYLNGSYLGSTASNTGTGTLSESYRWNMGAHQLVNEVASFTFDETRVRASDVGTNWITTEYNNQSAESTFWGTWSNVSGSTSGGNFLMFM